MGLSSAELESLNELIHIDHIYFKPQPSVHYKDDNKEVVEAPQDIALKVNNSEVVIPHQYSHPPCQLTTPPLRSKRDSRGNIIPSTTTTNLPPVVVSNTPQFIANPASTSLDVDTIAQDLVDSFSYSDIDSSLDLFQSLELSNLLDSASGPVVNSNIQCQPKMSPSSLSEESYNTNVSHPNTINTQHSTCAISNISKSEIDSKKLFDELCDSYLSIKNSLSPDHGNFSDSGFGSDVGEALSPEDSEEYLLDDYPWQDSFTDLFPDLQ